MVDLFRLEPGDLGGGGLVHGLELGAGPDLAAVAVELDGAVERLHRRVGEVRHLVLGLEPSGWPCPARRRRRPSPGPPGRRCATSARDSAAQLARCRASAPGPEVPVDLQRRRARSFAAQEWAATTATPLGTWTTCSTPGTCAGRGGVERLQPARRTPAARATIAVRSPGNCTSMPNRAWPVIFSGVSSRRIGLPMSFQSSGALRVTVVGRRERQRPRSASWPKEARRLPSMTTPGLDLSLRRVGSSILRRRRGRAASGASGADLAVAVELAHGGGRAAGHLDAACRCGRRPARPARARRGSSTSRSRSSSAISIGSAVQMPWPISEWARSTVTESSVPMRRKALGGGSGFFFGRAGEERLGPRVARRRR